MARPKRLPEDDPVHSDGPALDHLVGYNLKRVYMIFNADFRATLGEDGLSTRVFSVLALIAGQPGITQSAVARHLGIERSGLVAIVDALQERGFAERAPVRGDRRAQALSPTAAGLAAFNAAAAAVEAHEDALLSVLSIEEREQLDMILAKLRWAHEQSAEGEK